MKKINKILLVSGLAILLLFINFRIDSNKAQVSLEFMGTKTLAKQATIGDCTDNGYRNWDAANPLRPSGKDCWCQDRVDVKTDCN